MTEFLVRSGALCAVAVAKDGQDAIAKVLADYAAKDGAALGLVLEVVDLAACDDATTYFHTEQYLERLGFKEDACGSGVTPTIVLSTN